MNLLYSIQKELYAAWIEATYPLFPASSTNDYFYTEQFNYYQSLKDKVIDTNSGESLFSAATDSACSMNGAYMQMTKVQRRNLSEASAEADFLARNWKAA